VQITAVDAAAHAASVLVAVERIEVEERSVGAASTTFAREHRLLTRDVDVGREHRLELVGQRVGKWRKRPARSVATRFPELGGEEQRHQRCASAPRAERDASGCVVLDGESASSHRDMVTNSPRRSM
jgi:hypothetical protein